MTHFHAATCCNAEFFGTSRHARGHRSIRFTRESIYRVRPICLRWRNGAWHKAPSSRGFRPVAHINIYRYLRISREGARSLAGEKVSGEVTVVFFFFFTFFPDVRLGYIYLYWAYEFLVRRVSVAWCVQVWSWDVVQKVGARLDLPQYR